MPQVVLGGGPFLLRQLFAGEDLECGAKGLDGLVEQLGGPRPLRPGGEVAEGGAQVVLGHGPVLGQLLAGVDLECGAVGLDGLVEQLGGPRPLRPVGEVAEGVAQVVLGGGPVLEIGRTG